MKKKITLLLCVLAAFSCSHHNTAYQQEYSYIKKIASPSRSFSHSDFFIVFLVDARHLDYSDSQHLIRSLVRNPMTRQGGLDVGHAWIYLSGEKDGERVVVEGGHTGEWGDIYPRYVEGVLDYATYGVVRPDAIQKKKHLTEENPIKYLWTPLYDGSFQQGSGGHIPTYAVKVDITEGQFDAIRAFIHPDNYYYAGYSLTNNQCASFVTRVAALIDIYIKDTVTLPILETAVIAGKKIRLWKDPAYSSITFSSPDRIEKHLMELAESQHGESALGWYVSTMPKEKP
jgi:hypothetical protein